MVIPVEVDLRHFRSAANSLRRCRCFHRGGCCGLPVEIYLLTWTRNLVDSVDAEFERAVFHATLGNRVDYQEAHVPMPRKCSIIQCANRALHERTITLPRHPLAPEAGLCSANVD